MRGSHTYARPSDSTSNSRRGADAIIATRTMRRSEPPLAGAKKGATAGSASTASRRHTFQTYKAPAQVAAKTCPSPSTDRYATRAPSTSGGSRRRPASPKTCSIIRSHATATTGPEPLTLSASPGTSISHNVVAPRTRVTRETDGLCASGTASTISTSAADADSGDTRHMRTGSGLLSGILNAQSFGGITGASAGWSACAPVRGFFAFRDGVGAFCC